MNSAFMFLIIAAVWFNVCATSKDTPTVSTCNTKGQPISPNIVGADGADRHRCGRPGEVLNDGANKRQVEHQTAHDDTSGGRQVLIWMTSLEHRGRTRWARAIRRKRQFAVPGQRNPAGAVVYRRRNDPGSKHESLREAVRREPTRPTGNALDRTPYGSPPRGGSGGAVIDQGQSAVPNQGTNPFGAPVHRRPSRLERLNYGGRGGAIIRESTPTGNSLERTRGRPSSRGGSGGAIITNQRKRYRTRTSSHGVEA